MFTVQYVYIVHTIYMFHIDNNFFNFAIKAPIESTYKLSQHLFLRKQTVFLRSSEMYKVESTAQCLVPLFYTTFVRQELHPL